MPVVRCPNFFCNHEFRTVYDEEGWKSWYFCTRCGGIVHVKINNNSRVKKVVYHNEVPPSVKIVVGEEVNNF